MSNEDLFQFASENKNSKVIKDEIKVLTIDDEAIVHDVTNLVLSDFKFKDSKLNLLNAYNVEEAKDILCKNNDIALVLVDIIMETDDAGFKIIKYIRETLNNQEVRIIIRTGETGGTPKEEIIQNYDIDGYREKSDLSNLKLFSTVYSALKTYNDIQKIKENEKKILEKEHLILKQSKMILISEMIDNISHQWRQPLSLISTIASGIQVKSKYYTLDTNEVVLDMQHIMEGVSYLTQTIDDFRDFYKAGDTKENFTLENIFNSIFKILQYDAKSKEVEFICNFNAVSFFGVKNDIIQVLMSIVLNAKEQLVNSKNKHIHKKLILIDTYMQDDTLIVKIQDNAGGIPIELNNKIFNSYFTTKDDGLGIGLYISNLIVKENLKGKLEFTNKSFIHKNNKYLGACFKLTI